MLLSSQKSDNGDKAGLPTIWYFYAICHLDMICHFCTICHFHTINTPDSFSCPVQKLPSTIRVLDHLSAHE